MVGRNRCLTVFGPVAKLPTAGLSQGERAEASDFVELPTLALNSICMTSSHGSGWAPALGVGSRCAAVSSLVGCLSRCIRGACE